MNASGVQEIATVSTVRRQRSRRLSFVRPRFLTELAVVPSGEQVMIDGGERFQVFQGGATGNLLPRLIRLMDGSRTLEDLENALHDIPSEDVRAAILLLGNSGLLEEGTGHAAHAVGDNAETLAFFQRYRSTTRANANGLEALRKLQASQVIAVGAGQDRRSAEILKSLLEKTGIRRVTLLESLEAWKAQEATIDGESVVVSLCFAPEDRTLHATLDECCRQRKLPWLRVVVDPVGNFADMGPLFNGAQNACYTCFAEVQLPAAGSEFSVEKERAEIDVHFWTSMAAAEIIYILSRAAPSSTSRDFRRYDLRGQRYEKLRWPRIPGCPCCRPVPARLLDTAIVFEDYIALPSLAFYPAKTQDTKARLGARLSREAKRLENCTQYPLNPQLSRLERPVLDVLNSDPAAAHGKITLDELSTLLLVTGGIRSQRGGRAKVQRWAATAGNLGSVELFVAVRNIEGLAPGLYLYQPHEHSLAAFRRRGGRLSIEEFMRRSTAADAHNLPDALVLFTAAFHRVSAKYATFAYRLVNMDAGAAMSQLHLAARSLGLASRTAGYWADDLIEEHLNLDPPNEQVTGVVELYAQSMPPGSTDLQVQRGGKSLGKPASYFREMPLQQVFQNLYAESRTREHELYERSSTTPHSPSYRSLNQLRNGAGDSTQVVRLPSSLGGGRFVGDVLPKRTSVRRYSADTIALQQLASMLRCAHFGDVTDWREESLDQNSLEFVVLAWRVSGIDAGVYKYQAGDHALVWQTPVPLAPESGELFVQQEFSTAPVVVWIAGNLGNACALHGAFGHRQLLLRAGAAAHRMWMAALAMGFSGAITAGLVPGEARRRLGFDGYRRASLLACAAGCAASSAARYPMPANGAVEE